MLFRKSGTTLLCCAAALLLAACSSGDNGASGTIPSAAIATALPASSTGQTLTAAATLRQATATASSSVLFADNFAADVVGTPAKGWNAEAGVWNVCRPPGVAPSYCSQSQFHEMSVPTIAGNAWTDYEFDADVTNPTAGSYELLARIVDASHFYAFSFEPSASKTSQPWYLRKFADNAWTDFQHGVIGVAPGAVVHTRFILAGHTLTVYASGSGAPLQLASVTDSSYAKGGIGLRTSGTSSSYVGNIVVSSGSTGTAPSPSPAPVASHSPAPAPSHSPTPGPVPSAMPTNPSGPGVRVTPVNADHIADMVGMDSHFSYHDTPYATSAVRTTLMSSDFRHYRDSTFGISNGSLGLLLTETAADIAAKRKLSPDAQYFELCGNEEDNNSTVGSNWPSVLQKCVAAQLPLVRPYGLPVVAPSLALVQNSQRLGHLNVDYANIHFSTCGDNPGTTRYATIASAAAASAYVAAKYWVTETSYDSRRTATIDNSLYGRGCAIPDRYIAAYDVRTIFEWERIGAGRVYFYQGADVPSDTVFGGTGLINPSGSPKPQFTALTNLIALFSDSGASSPGNPLNVSIAAGSIVHDIVTQKANGTVLVAIWREATDIMWETQKATNLPLAPASVSVAGYAVTALHEFQPDGSLKTVTTSSGVLGLGPDAVVVELHRT